MATPRAWASFADYWQAYLKRNLIQATLQGKHRFDDQLPNVLSAQYRQASHDFTTGWLAGVQAIGNQGLQSQDLLSYEVFVRKANALLEGKQFPDWMSPSDQPAWVSA